MKIIKYNYRYQHSKVNITGFSFVKCRDDVEIDAVREINHQLNMKGYRFSYDIKIRILNIEEIELDIEEGDE
jgi:hypothetical protein